MLHTNTLRRLQTAMEHKGTLLEFFFGVVYRIYDTSLRADCFRQDNIATQIHRELNDESSKNHPN